MLLLNVALLALSPTTGTHGGSHGHTGDNAIAAADPSRSLTVPHTLSAVVHASRADRPSLAVERRANADVVLPPTSFDRNPLRHPMNWNIPDLQVDAPSSSSFSHSSPIFTPRDVRDSYLALARVYLSPFSNRGGISREHYLRAFAAKTKRAVLFQIKRRRVYLYDPHRVPFVPFKPFYRTRLNEVIWLLSSLAASGRVAYDTEFVFTVTDCVHSANEHHAYRLTNQLSSMPVFTLVSCNFSDNVPLPVWETGRDGPLSEWDDVTAAFASGAIRKRSDSIDNRRKTDDVSTLPWEQRQKTAIFRGANRPSMFWRDPHAAERNCAGTGRSRLLHLSQLHPDLFNVSLRGACGGRSYAMHSMSMRAQQALFRYVVYAEGNCMWADRLRLQLFGQAAVLKQMTPCGQFFEPLLKPFVHVVPTEFFFDDAPDKVRWMQQRDDVVTRIVANANAFAKAFLSTDGLKTYVEVLLGEYTKLLRPRNGSTREIVLEKESRDVTFQRL